jgi:hypothetical protein
VTTATAASVQVVALSPFRRADRARFIAVPAPLHRGDPRYVPPLRREVHGLLDPSRNPWHRHAEMALFVALQDGVAVGRVAAIRDRRHDEVRAERAGCFGFFDCVDDRQCAEALLAEAERWARSRGATTMRGPISPSMHDECGCLVEGFDAPPVIQMPYNPPYQGDLLEACGYRKAQDLLAYEFLASQDVRPPIARVAQAVEASGEFRLRTVDRRRFRREVETLRALYNAAWDANWGFVPLDADEIAWRAGRLRPLVDPRIALFVEARRERGFEPVAFALAVPDVNEILVGLDGRLTPLALLRLVRGLRRVRTMRLLLLGVIAPYRRRGLEALLVREIHRRGAQAGFARAELSWVLEDNVVMNRTIVKAGGRHYKTYRIYEKRLTH